MTLIWRCSGSGVPSISNCSTAPAPRPWRSRPRPAGPSAGSVMFCVDTQPSGPTQAQRLATQIDDDVIAMPKAPVVAQRAEIEYVIALHLSNFPHRKRQTMVRQHNTVELLTALIG